MRIRTWLLSIAVAASLASPASADIVEKQGTFAGLKVTYKVVLPKAYDAARSYPMVLVFTGGPQTLQILTTTLEVDWQAEAEKRGYIVVSPASPNGELFFEGADKIFPSFIDEMLKIYKVRGKIHLAGHSNGGLSAFHIAAKYPQYFSTLTGYPGLLDGPDLEKIAVLKPMCLFMHVGERDPGWRGAMEDQAAAMKKDGYRIQITVEKNQIHRIKAPEVNLSPRLMDEIESCK